MATFEIQKGKFTIVTDNEGRLQRADYFCDELDCFLECTENVKNRPHMMRKVEQGFADYLEEKGLADTDNRIKYDKENTL